MSIARLDVSRQDSARGISSHDSGIRTPTETDGDGAWPLPMTTCRRLFDKDFRYPFMLSEQAIQEPASSRLGLHNTDKDEVVITMSRIPTITDGQR